MEKSPVMLAVLTMMMVKSVNAQFDPSCADDKLSGSPLQKEKFRKVLLRDTSANWPDKAARSMD